MRGTVLVGDWVALNKTASRLALTVGTGKTFADGFPDPFQRAPVAIPARTLMDEAEIYASEQNEPDPITDYAARRGE